MTGAKFTFEHMGIGAVLRRERLRVPPNQRSYAWEEGHVEDLFTDLSGAIREGSSDYFLGTIVLTQQDSSIPEVADGQQRLATVSILLAAIRDRFTQMGRDARAKDIDANFLRQLAEDIDDTVPKFTLNTDDADFFIRYVLSDENDRKNVDLSNLRESNIKIRKALDIAKRHVQNIVSEFKDNDQIARTLLDWINFIRTHATVVVVTVPSHVDAYRMFETLNDRGLRASQADLLKNYLFSRAQRRLNEAQARWSSLSGAIESIGDDGDLVTYIRHFWICNYGPTREKELADQIRNNVTGETKTIGFLTELDNRVQDYIALFNPSARKWSSYSDYCKDYIRVFVEDLRVEQVRPLLFAISTHFDPSETEKAFRLIVAWSVRFLIVGGRGGFLDRNYSFRAQDVGTGRITTAKQLSSAMREQVPQDVTFEEHFRTARASKNWSARYYLRSLDLTMSGETEPENIANRNKDVLTLEHVLPRRPGAGWNIGDEVALACQNRLGNMTLLRASKNVEAGSGGFSDKKRIYQQSNLPITRQILEYDSWGIKQVDDRQAKMAKLAVKTWPIGA